MAASHDSIDQAFVTAWDNAIRETAQQSESRLLACVLNEGTVEGEAFTHNFMGSTEMDEVNDRLGDTIWGAVEHKTPIAPMQDFYKALPLDRKDIPRMKVNPVAGGNYMGTLIKAKNRKVDDIIYKAAIGTQGLKDGSTIVLPNTQKILAGGTGLTKGKLITVRKIFRVNENDQHAGEELVMLYDDAMLEDVLADTTLTSADFMAVKMLQAGDVSGKWMGFEWIPYNKFNLNGTVRTGLAMTKTAVKFGMGYERGNVSERNDKQDAYQVSYAFSGAALRTEEKGVVAVEIEQ